MSSEDGAEALLKDLLDRFGVAGYRHDDVMRQLRRLGGMMRAIEERVLLEDQMPLHGMVSRYEGPRADDS